MYRVKCKHETEDVPVSVVLDDYYPLTQKEVEGLLVKAAIFRSDVSRFSDIQCRLVQGIPGLVCPHEITGKVAKKMHLIDSAFQRVNSDNTDELTDYIMSIYNTEWFQNGRKEIYYGIIFRRIERHA